jgi:hypothetical protein
MWCHYRHHRQCIQAARHVGGWCAGASRLQPQHLVLPGSQLKEQTVLGCVQDGAAQQHHTTKRDLAEQGLAGKAFTCCLLGACFQMLVPWLSHQSIVTADVVPQA